jgi:hypothetical protein
MTDYTATGAPAQGSRGVSQLIRTEFTLIETAINSKANIASPAFTGTPTAPTATLGTSSTQLATTEFVANTAFSSVLPGQAGNAGKFLTTDGTNASWEAVNPINFSRATVASHATTSDIWSDAEEIDFTGTVTVTAFPAAPQAGAMRILHMAAAASFTNSANLILPGGLDYTAIAGDIVTVHAITTTQFRLYIQPNSQPGRALYPFSDEAADLQPLIPPTNLITYKTRQPIGAFTEGSFSFCSGNSLFACTDPSAASTSVYTSPDGETWTLRTLPSSANWTVGASSTQFMALGTATQTAISTDGVTWTAKTATPSGVPENRFNSPKSIEDGDTFVVCDNGTTLYKTVNAGVAWTSQTTNTNSTMLGFYVVGGLLWHWSTGTTAYTSATGLTSSWTSRTLPVTPDSINVIQQSPDGSIVIANNGVVAYRTTDGINWTALSAKSTGANAAPIYINGSVFGITTTLTSTWYWNGTKQITFLVGSLAMANPSSDHTDVAYDSTNGVYLIPLTSGYYVIIDENFKWWF